MTDLDRLLACEPSTAAWNDVVAWFDGQLVADARIDDRAVAVAEAVLATWPPSIVRPLPYGWIFRLCVHGSFAPARLADALCLGDRWALHPGVGITAFRTLSRRQLDCLATTRDLPAVRHIDVSYRTDEHPHSPGTMLARLDALPEFLAAAPFTGLVSLDLAFTSVTIDEVAEILAAHPALRALSLGACESDEFDDDALATLLELPALARLEHLELQRMGSGGAAAIRAILDCPHLADLQTLVCKLDPTLLGEDGLHADEFRELLAASGLTPTVQATLREPYADKYGFYEPRDRFAAIFPGEPGAPFDAADDEDDDG